MSAAGSLGRRAGSLGRAASELSGMAPSKKAFTADETSPPRESRRSWSCSVVSASPITARSASSDMYADSPKTLAIGRSLGHGRQPGERKGSPVP
eukprot:6511280-Prymnesium_polylepis.1